MPETSLARAAIDVDLVRRFLAGEETAFNAIVAHYRERITSLAYGMLKNHADAEEIAQDTFIRAHRGLAQFRGESSLGTWLNSIASNLARNRYWYFHRRARNLTLSLDVTDDDRLTLVNLMATRAPCPATETVTKEFLTMITSCVDKLGEVDRQILALRNTHNRSYDEIAKELSLNEGTVKSRLARARKRLRDLLFAEFPDLEPDIPLADWFMRSRPAPSVIVA